MVPVVSLAFIQSRSSSSACSSGSRPAWCRWSAEMLVEVPVVRAARPAAGTLSAVGGEQLIVQRGQVRRAADEVVHLQVVQADPAGLDAQQRLTGEVAR